MSERRFRDILLDPQFITLAVVLLAMAGIIYLAGPQLAPFGIALILAFHLDEVVNRLVGRGFSRRWAVASVFVGFLIVYTVALLGPLQVAIQRTIQLASQLPRQADKIAEMLQDLPDLTFGLLPPDQKSKLLNFVIEQLQEGLNVILPQTITWIPRFTGWLVYLFLIPLIVFFFLKDKEALMSGVARCLPKNRQLVEPIWREMVEKMGNYVRGKIWEILVVGLVTWLALALLGFRYPLVMGAISGISVLIPYVGAIGVAIPVFILGYLQWGFGWDLGWVMIAYTVIQLVDGNIVVPYIFSEAVKLHPVTILLAVFFFGGLWGLWGVFFAIPLATLVKSLITTILDYREKKAA